MGLLGAIVGGVIGAAVGGPWGAIAGVGIGSAIGGEEKYYSSNFLTGHCPHCNAQVKLPTSSIDSAYTCPSCNNYFLVVQCPHCDSIFVGPDIGDYQCSSCSKKVFVGFCPHCEEVVVSPTHKTKHSCGTTIAYQNFQSESDMLVFLLTGQVALACLMGKIDGYFDESEKKSILNFYQNMGLGSEALSLISNLIEKFDKEKIPYTSIADELNGYLGYNDKITLLKSLFEVMLADGRIDEKEEALIKKIYQRLNISKQDYDNLYHYYIHTKEDELIQYYMILGFSQKCSVDEVKTRYKELAKKYHPDKFEHLGEEFAEIASIKFQEIKNAYDKILEAS